jgi:hypothetical protein
VNERSTIELLADLARLIRKHGPTTFSDLAALLRDPEKVHELTSILDVGALAGRNATIRKRKSTRQRYESASGSLLHLISETKRADPAKGDLLLKFYEDLSAKRVLPSLRDLRDFAGENHLIGSSADARQKAIGPLIRDMRRLPTEQLRQILGRVETTEGANDDRSLERWTNIILNKDRSRDSS